MSAANEDTSATPLPPPPSQDPLSAEQWSILAAIADTVTPSFAQSTGNRLLQHPLRGEVYDATAKRLRDLSTDAASSDVVPAYLAENATAQPEFKEHMMRLLAFYMTEMSRKPLSFILSTLNTRAGALLLTGHATPLNGLSVQDRELILQGWARSRLPPLRFLHRSLITLVRLFWLRTSPTVPQVLAYPRFPVNAVNPGPGFPFQFVQIPPSVALEPEVIETDVVIVGSGCGGAVAAKTLAEAGLKVLVVDQSYYWSPEWLPMSDEAAGIHLFGNGGAVISQDGSIMVLAGSTWGGGGTINWSASLQPQGIVRREWAHKFGLKHFTGAEFQADLDAVCERMGVSYANIKHNKGNRVLMEGARKLGWTAKPVPQNTGGEEHSDGFCTRGCRCCGKKGPTVTFLPDAADAGANFMEGFKVKEIVFGKNDSNGNREVTGVRGTWTARDTNGGVVSLGRTTREVMIKARRTIISGGSLYTPHLLQQSGLKNKHIGRHLHLHPVCMLAAVWDEDIRDWEGPILTSVVSEFENLDGDGYGTKLECTTMIPGSFLPVFPWYSGQQWKEFVAKMRRMSGYISITRDRYGGRVIPDPADGSLAIDYTLSTYDRNHILEGLVRLAELNYVEGAREIHVSAPGIQPFIRPKSSPKVPVTPLSTPSVTDAEFQSWLQKLRAGGLPSPDAGFASAHQMGSCRMGTSPKNSVVDYRGRVWGTSGLYIADASVFPSASGVNPMITTMGISRNISRGIVDEERGDAGLTLDPSAGRAKL
ncbi:hypothetical protein M409DRAFT_28555 [Zasmidium cellare ATCC 36951]|uniref:Long-chain-alcohol oxidase n=1 Tax=Zasmidium cellare ATCC 36951 TaxID=1080233 RepID=A0A6A6C443_ZASCE|nr:uncharacterized protein M409DRAFT_28555 [Zasmidium cellare ATCC 36951]KAF2160950.1 hypothetical protein M409DRAFT_28555 [Zasmidium cellare ATCC 36951]